MKQHQLVWLPNQEAAGGKKVVRGKYKQVGLVLPNDHKIREGGPKSPHHCSRGAQGCYGPVTWST